MVIMPKTSKPAATAEPHVLSEKFADPDIVDSLFAYLLDQVPAFRQAVGDRTDELKRMVRAEFGGERVTILKRTAEERRALVSSVLALFNGRNATEVARQLNISRPSVYRYLKQAGNQKASQTWRT